MNVAPHKILRCHRGWQPSPSAQSNWRFPNRNERLAQLGNAAVVGLPIDQIGQMLTSAVAAHLGPGVFGLARILFAGNTREDSPTFGFAEPGQAVGHGVEFQVYLNAERGVGGRRLFWEISDLKPRATAPFGLDLVPRHHGHPSDHAFLAIEAIGVTERLHGGRLQRVVDRVLGSTASLQCPADPFTHLRPHVVPVQRRISSCVEISCYRVPVGALR